MKIKLSLFLSACCLMGATADDLVMDNYERVSVVATNGDVTADSIFSAPKAAAIEKTGTDALTLAANAVQTRDKVPVRVLEGTLNVVPGTDPGLEQPACLQRAALWLDATQSATLVPPDGATGDEVARWYDVRETCTDGQWSANYYCAENTWSFHAPFAACTRPAPKTIGETPGTTDTTAFVAANISSSPGARPAAVHFRNRYSPTAIRSADERRFVNTTTSPSASPPAR